MNIIFIAPTDFSHPKPLNNVSTHHESTNEANTIRETAGVSALPARLFARIHFG